MPDYWKQPPPAPRYPNRTLGLVLIVITTLTLFGLWAYYDWIRSEPKQEMAPLPIPDSGVEIAPSLPPQQPPGR